MSLDRGQADHGILKKKNNNNIVIFKIIFY